ncbi:MAG: glycosyltransferase [Veillonellales bacterium]
MHILVVPSWYPSEENPILGIFFKEQAEALAKTNETIGVLVLREDSILNIKKILKYRIRVNHFSIKNDSHIQYLELCYISFPKIKSIKKLQRDILVKVITKKYIKIYGKPDIIHLHSFLAGDIALRFKRKYKIPYVVTEHSTGFARDLFPNNDIEYATTIYRNSSKCIAVSNEFCSLLKEKTKCNFIYIPNMVNAKRFIIKYFDNKSYFQFVNIASLDEKKNQIMLVRAFYNQFRSVKDVKLVIAGEGPLKQNIQKEIVSLGIDDQVILFGKASRDEVKTLLQSSDAFVLSSRHETFGVVLIEAMSCGLPVVATKSGGPESIVANKKLGELTEIDVDSLATGMSIVYNSYYDKEYIRKYAIDHFSEDAVTSQLINVYNEIIENR